MNISEMAQAAVILSTHGPQLVESTHRIPDSFLQRYWEASRRRTATWRRTLTTEVGNHPHSSEAWSRVEPILTDIFVSELLTRVWGGLLTAADQRLRIRHAEPIVRAVLLDHIEAHNLALRVMVRGAAASIPDVARTEQFRRRCERWTDSLLGHLVLNYALDEFAHDIERAREFGSDQISADGRHLAHRVADFMRAGMRLSFLDTAQISPCDPEAHMNVLNAALGCFPADAFADDGPLKSVEHTRFRRSGMRSDRFPGPTDGLIPPRKNPRQSHMFFRPGSLNLPNINDFPEGQE